MDNDTKIQGLLDRLHERALAGGNLSVMAVMWNIELDLEQCHFSSLDRTVDFEMPGELDDPGFLSELIERWHQKPVIEGSTLKCAEAIATKQKQIWTKNG